MTLPDQRMRVARDDVQHILRHIGFQKSWVWQSATGDDGQNDADLTSNVQCRVGRDCRM